MGRASLNVRQHLTPGFPAIDLEGEIHDLVYFESQGLQSGDSYLGILVGIAFEPNKNFACCLDPNVVTTLLCSALKSSVGSCKLTPYSILLAGNNARGP